MSLRALPYVIIVGLLFGMSIIASRFAVDQFDPLVYVGLRLTLATVTFAGFYLFAGRRNPFPTDRGLWQHALVLGIFGTAIPMSTFVAALQFQSSGVTSILTTTGPALIVVLAHFALEDEFLTPFKSIGVTLALTGAILLALRGETGLTNITQANPIGYVLVAISLCSHSAATIYARKYTRTYRAFDVTSSQIAIGMVIVMVWAALTVGFDLQRVNAQGLLSLIYGGIAGTFGAFLLYFITVKQFGATAAAMSNYIVPVTATIGGVLLLGETVTSGMTFGMSLILGGIALTNYRRAPRRVLPRVA